ncbi:MAG: peptide ABC transporter substrate-binding protein [Candidatus Nealsonbacteria bacterium DGGOD1a]|nr:MAG: peptide ABC transporter substrate-binding protein [Candidatus Nealsonbacteria bacterium DGGOD1a]
MKFPSLVQWKQFFKILSRKEKPAFFIFAFLAVASAITLTAALYANRTMTVAADNGSYIEGIVGQPRFLNPVYSDSYSADQDIARLLFAGLLEYDSNGRITSGLADYNISDDGKTYEFTLKDNLYWSDGAPITSEDAIYTIKTIQDPAYKSPLRPQWIGVETEKISDTGFRLKLKNPYASFLENCTLKLIPSHIWTAANSDNFPLSPFNLNPVVSGAYLVKKLNLAKDGQATSIELERNPKFYGQKSNLQKITFVFFDNYADLVSAFKRGRVQGFVPSADIGVSGLAGANSFNYSMPRYFAIFFNPDANKVLEDAQVRAALAYATDKNEILTNALGGKGATVDSPVPTDIYSLAAPATVYDYDIQKANQILDDAGYKQGSDGLRAKNTSRQPAFQFNKTLVKGTNLNSDVKELQKCLAREVMPSLEANGNFGDQTLEAVKLFQEKYRADILDPQKIEKATGEVKLATREKLNAVCFPSGNTTAQLNITLTIAKQEPFNAVAQIIKNQWAKIGVTVNINAVDIANIERDSVKPRAYEALLFGQALGTIPDPYPFWHSSQKADPGLNFAQYENKDADKLLEEIRGLTDQNAREEKLRIFQDMIAKEEPAIFLYNPSYIFIASKDVKGVKTGIITGPGQRFAGIADWYTDTKRIWK